MSNIYREILELKKASELSTNFLVNNLTEGESSKQRVSHQLLQDENVSDQGLVLNKSLTTNETDHPITEQEPSQQEEQVYAPIEEKASSEREENISLQIKTCF